MKNPFSESNASQASSLLATIVENSDDAIISKDLSGTITSWNKAAERIFGYQASEVVGRPISVIIPSDKGPEEVEILQRLSRGERIDHFETARLRRDGKTVEVSVTISPLIQDGKIVGASKIARDITERKRIEREIEQERARLEVTLASIGDAVIVTDMDGAVEFLNSMAETLTGWKFSDASGQPLEAVFNIVNETTRRRVENPAARALREGVVVGLANHTVLIAKNGTEYSIDDSAAPIRGRDGEILGVVLVFRDVSATRAAADFRARLAAIVQSSDDAIIGKDLNGRISAWNAGAERLFGYLAEEVMGRPISMLIPPDRLAEETEILARIQRGERAEHVETIRITKDRRKVDVSLTVSPIYDGDGHVVGASKTARDITHRKRMDRELAEARERLERHSVELEKTVAERTAELKAAYGELETFSYTVAHDLRAPLRAILGFLSVLKEDLDSGSRSDQEEAFQKISASAERMNQLLDDLLKLSTIGKQELQTKPASLDTLVQQALAELKPATEGRRIEWRIEPLPMVQCDVGLMRQAFINLLSNALKYTRPRPVARIEVGRKAVDGQTAFYVRDNGVGFNMEQAAKLFMAFHRLHPERQFEGNGIGLATVERIIRKHGGRIWAEAEPDRGAVFYFTLQDASLKP